MTWVKVALAPEAVLEDSQELRAVCEPNFQTMAIGGGEEFSSCWWTELAHHSTHQL